MKNKIAILFCSALIFVSLSQFCFANVILQDDFESGDISNWIKVNHGPITLSVTEINGNKVLSGYGSGALYLPLPDKSDYIAEGDFFLYNVDYLPYAFGLMFRAKGTEIPNMNAYIFQVRGGTAEVEKWTAGYPFYYQSIVYGNFAQPGKWQHIKVVCKGWYVRAYVDNNLILEFMDIPARKGGVGIRFWGVGAYFDNLKVTSFVDVNAGADQVVEQSQADGAYVTLNGTGAVLDCAAPLSFEWTWNGGSATGTNPTILLPLGTTPVTLRVSGCGLTETDEVLITVKENTPPETTATVSGTMGGNGWYTSNVDIALTAIDSGSGVKEIRYSINNGAETVVSGSIANISLTADGVYAIQYYAVDNADNKETAHPLTIKIDRAVPVVQITPSNTILWPPNHKLVPITINGSAVDNESGIASVVITVTDEYGTYNQTVTGGFGTTINLEAWREGTDKDGRVYTITATATDKAGNVSTAVTTVTVPHDMGK